MLGFFSRGGSHDDIGKAFQDSESHFYTINNTKTDLYLSEMFSHTGKEEDKWIEQVSDALIFKNYYKASTYANENRIYGVYIKEHDIAKKPPIGIVPRFIWLERRYTDLQEAIKRYTDAKLNVPAEWVDEEKILWDEISTRSKDFSKLFPSSGRDWTEDFPNSKTRKCYVCHKNFFGSDKRVLCKICNNLEE